MKKSQKNLAVVNPVLPVPRQHQQAARGGAIGGAIGGVVGAILGGPVGAFVGAALLAGTGAAIGAQEDLNGTRRR